ncbi:MAG: ABC transporter substrate-binding protein [Deltaproteobacteria bacterium]|nr:ABC transporter substrate-binding protein [Deltaproteobacteria bacterium]
MKIPKIILILSIGFSAIAWWARPAAALDNIVIGYPTTSSQFVPLWFAKDAGLYEKHGLDSKLVYIQGGSLLLQAMLAGQVQSAQTGVTEVVLAALRGADMKFLGITAKIFPYTLIGSKEVKSAGELKRGKIAVNRLGSDVSAVGTRMALRKLGLNPEKDVTMLQVGGSPQRLAALQSGSVQGAALDFMSALRLAKQGFNVLSQVNLNYPYLGLLISGRFLRENQPAAEAFVKAFTEAIARFKNNREEGIRAISRYMKTNEADVLSKAYDFISKDFYGETLEPDAEAFRNLLDEIGEREPAARKASVHQFFDLSIVRKLEKEGFFKAIYKK